MLLFLGLSCSKDTDEVISEEEVNYYTPEDIEGVWLYPNPKDSLYFISFSEDGRYSYCLHYRLMGSGTYIMENNKLTLYDGFFGKKQELEITSVSETTIYFNGIFYKHNSDEYTHRFHKMKKSKEKVSPRISGRGLNGMRNSYSIYKYVDAMLRYSDYVVEYKLMGTYKTNHVTIDYDNWFYVYRPPYTYTQQTKGDDLVQIFDFDNEPDLFNIYNNLIQQ